MRAKKCGFTLIEVMLAVCILALVATASLKLVVLSQNCLKAAKEKEAFWDTVQKLRAQILTEEISENGAQDDFNWKTEVKQKEFFNEAFGKLDFNKKTQAIKQDATFSWRELEIIESNTNQKMKLILPIAAGQSAKGNEATTNEKTTKKTRGL